MYVRVPPPALIVYNQNVAYSRSIKSGQMGKSVGKVPAKFADVVDVFTALKSNIGVHRSSERSGERNRNDFLDGQSLIVMLHDT
jgi:hypothetical protein